MIVVDTSVWIDYFNGKSNAATDTLFNLLGADEILIGDLILKESSKDFSETSNSRKPSNYFDPVARTLMKSDCGSIIQIWIRV